MTDLTHSDILADYDDPSRLESRFKPFREWNQGQYLYDRIMDQVDAVLTARESHTALDFGCGNGEFLSYLADNHIDHSNLIGIDQSVDMLKECWKRGMIACSPEYWLSTAADYDYIFCNWMLYHLDNLDDYLHEFSLCSEVFVATTFGKGMLHEVWDLVGGEDLPLSFNAENGKDILERHFKHVESIPIHGTCLFPNRDAIVEYIEATLTRKHLSANLPEDIDSLVATTTNHLFIARN